ncbi:MAG: hypothetical protein Harvfovirus55_6 [Harvfovirus sp.]|uniref:Uncharacterized protein n=1 Tax=Harvfovirus sp. TaxID=2487768 RepID=A0A3G5A3D0_9VIRU|nr:MAG: hypothetical protein Harvfovirus55_6 [Harvfovirus sp.]
MDAIFLDFFDVLENGTIGSIRAYLKKIPEDIYLHKIPFKDLAVAVMKRNNVEIFQLVIHWGFGYLFGTDYVFVCVGPVNDYLLYFVLEFFRLKPGRIDVNLLYNTVYKLAQSLRPSGDFSFVRGYNDMFVGVMDSPAVGLIIKSVEQKTMLRIIGELSRIPREPFNYKRYRGTQIAQVQRLNNIYSRDDLDEIERSDVIFEYAYHDSPIGLIVSDVLLHSPRLINVVISGGGKFPKRMILGLLAKKLRELICESSIVPLIDLFSHMKEENYKEIFYEWIVGDWDLIHCVNCLYLICLKKQCYRPLKFVFGFLKYFSRDLEERCCVETGKLQMKRELILLSLEKEYMQKCFLSEFE